MANTVVGFSINIDGVQNIDQLNQAIKDTEKSLKGLTVGTEDYTKTAEKLAKLKAEQKAVKKNQDDLNKSYLEQSNALGSYDKAAAKLNRLRKAYKDLAIEGKTATKESKALKAEIDSLDKTLKETDASVGQFQRNVGNYGDAVKEIADNLGGLGGFAGQAVNGIRSFGAAFQAALGPIGLIIAAIGLVITSVKAFFNSSEEGQNKFRQLQAIATVVFNNLRDIFATLGEIIVGVFEKPVESIKAFGKFIYDNLTNRLMGLLELIPQLGKSIGLLFTGEFAKAGQVAGDALAKATLGVENFTQKATNGFNQVNKLLKEFNENTQKEIAQQLKLSKAQDDLDKQSRAILLQNAVLEQKIAEARNKFAQKDKYNNEERLKFLDDAFKFENQILKNSEYIAATRLKLTKEQNTINSKNGKKTKEMLEEEAQLEADLIRLRTDNLNKTKEMASQRVEALNAMNAEQQKLNDEEIKKAKEVEDAKKKFQEEELKFTEATAKLNKDIIEKTAKLTTNLIQDEFAKRRQAANENYNNDLKALQDNINATKIANQERLTKALELYKEESDEFKKIKQNTIDEEKSLQESYDSYRTQRESELVNELADIKQQEVNAELDAEEAKRKAIKETTDFQIEEQNKRYDNIKESVQKVADFTKLALDTLNGFADASDKRRLDQLAKDEEANNKMMDNLNERLNRATGLERRYLEQQIEQNKKTAESIANQKIKIEKDAAKRRKATAIIESVINTALAVSNALATPPAPNVVAALIAGIAGAAQTAVIAAQPLAKGGVVGKGDDIVQFANGGKVTSRGNIKPLSNGDNVLATLKTGEIVLNESQQRRIGYNTLKKAQIPNFATGGFVGSPTSLITSSNNSLASEQMRVNLMDEMINATNNRIDRLTVVYTATTDYEVEKGRNDKKTIKANSTF